MPDVENRHGHYIYRTYYTRKDGTRVYAKQYGKKHFVFGLTIKS